MAIAYTMADFESAIKYLIDEGYIERFTDADGNDCVRICEGAEECEV